VVSVCLCCGVSSPAVCAVDSPFGPDQSCGLGLLDTELGIRGDLVGMLDDLLLISLVQGQGVGAIIGSDGAVLLLVVVLWVLTTRRDDRGGNERVFATADHVDNATHLCANSRCVVFRQLHKEEQIWCVSSGLSDWDESEGLHLQGEAL